MFGRPSKVSTSQNKSLHLTGIGLAVQAFYINLTLDTVMGGEYAELQPVGPPLINTPGVWGVNGAYTGAYNTGVNGLSNNGIQALNTYGDRGYGAGGYTDANGFYHGNLGTKNGYDVGHAYGGGKDIGLTNVQGGSYGDVRGRNRGHQVAGFSTSYNKHESGNKATYYDDGLGHGGSIQYGSKDHRSRDGVGNAFGGAYHDAHLKTNAHGNKQNFGGGQGFGTKTGYVNNVGDTKLYGGGVGQGYTGTFNNGFNPALPVLPPAPVPYIPPPPVITPPVLPQSPVISGVFSPNPVITKNYQPYPSHPVGLVTRSSTKYQIPAPTKLFVDKAKDVKS
ncbi:glycine-rich cell wall structural protein 1.8-like [Diaphorina citri]|uniref:Glycine-rich cell wall structural protein 1.8-like n=1 Tax=Diaphorina citri TaxID=121845 RepID=A0A3Q0JA04_DIACI|nr:glycine-rich cell wall structural protein 1.8-like [Diaphorina citri]KAI5699377.1 hypothetical protein M8J75_001975 [Diaphorina citri]KAI5727051.1 hypothetical protein M8J76_013351 [Diaphorina citri]KAI5731877.1 hypothetical protein M8J77_017764 [Diaphorina citri]